MKITSFTNTSIQNLRKLIADREHRSARKQFVAEGVRLIEDAVTMGFTPQALFSTGSLSDRAQQLVRATPADARSEPLFARLAATENSQGLLAVFDLPVYTPPDALDFVLIADNLRDPGNLGTLLRSAASAGVQMALISPQSVDAFSPKVVRAGMGAHFHMPVVQAGWDEITRLCKAQRPPLQVLLADANAADSYTQHDLTQPLALVVGSEADGFGPESVALSTGSLCIPMPGGFESLNAAVAGSVMLFEVVRQRSAKR